MARPKKNTVDYFPHDVTHGRKMFFIESKYGNDGYAVWFKILEELGRASNHYLDLRDETTIMFILASFRVDKQTFDNIINDLLKLGEFDDELFKDGILYSEKFVNSVSDAYRKREGERPIKGRLIAYLLSFGRIKRDTKEFPAPETPTNEVTDGKNGESKVNKRKVNDNKEDGNEKHHQQQPKLFIDDNGKSYDKFEPNGKTYVPVEKAVKFESMDQVVRVLIASDWLNIYAKSSMIPIHENPQDWISKFQDFCITTGKNHLVLEEFKSHCFYWTKKQIENGVRLVEQPRTNGKPKQEDAITRANRLMAERNQKQQK